MDSNQTPPATASGENNSHSAFLDEEPRLRVVRAVFPPFLICDSFRSPLYDKTHDSAGPITITSSSLVQIIHNDLRKSREALSEHLQTSAIQSHLYLDIIEGLTSVAREKDTALADAQSTIRLLHGDQKRRVEFSMVFTELHDGRFKRSMDKMENELARLRYRVYGVAPLKVRAESKRSTELEGTIRCLRARLSRTEMALKEAKKETDKAVIALKCWKTTAIGRHLALQKQSTPAQLLAQFCEAGAVRFIFMAICDECDWSLWGLFLLVVYYGFMLPDTPEKLE